MAARLGKDVKTIGEAWRLWSAKRSPRILAGGLVLAVALRVALGALTWRDAVAAGAMLVIYPFGEWAIHVYLLHLPPFRWRGRVVELPTASSHRMHHEAPHDLNMIVFAPVEALALLLGAVPLVVGLGCLLVGLVFGAVPIGAAVTAGVVAYALILAYEWTHFLIHTAHRPRSRYFKSIWRTHRLHHFKNEHYWHGITNPVSDRVLRTNPDQRHVPRSPTARSLR
jgi:fatty acid hydroxylase family protein